MTVNVALLRLAGLEKTADEVVSERAMLLRALVNFADALNDLGLASKSAVDYLREGRSIERTVLGYSDTQVARLVNAHHKGAVLCQELDAAFAGLDETEDD